MSTFRPLLIAAAVAALGSPLAASAKGLAPGLVDATQPEAVLAAAKGYGSAELDTDSDGDPRILGRMDGIKYGVFFYGCTRGKECTDIQFTASWGIKSVTMEQVNAWNRDKRFGKAFINKEGKPVIEMAVSIDYGVTKENLDDQFAWWRKALQEFSKQVIKD